MMHDECYDDDDDDEGGDKDSLDTSGSVMHWNSGIRTPEQIEWQVLAILAPWQNTVYKRALWTLHANNVVQLERNSGWSR